MDINLKLEGLVEFHSVGGKDLRKRMYKLFEDYFEEADQFDRVRTKIIEEIEKLVNSNVQTTHKLK